MRTKTLWGFALLGFALALISVAHAAPEPMPVRTVPISDKDAAKLKGINHWLEENLPADDCPERSYYAIVGNVVVGYEVLAVCPESPTPAVPMFFDASQRFIEPRNSL